jgi:hypothetical protein
MLLPPPAAFSSQLRDIFLEVLAHGVVALQKEIIWLSGSRIISLITGAITLQVVMVQG